MITTFIVYFLWLLITIEGLKTVQALAYQVVNGVRCNPFNWSFWLAAIKRMIPVML